MKAIFKLSSMFVMFILLGLVLATLAMAQGNVLVEPSKTYFPSHGWHEGKPVAYYELGVNTYQDIANPTIEPAPIYIFITGFAANGEPQLVEGQKNIISVIPGDEGYSSLWQVNLVTVSADYVPNMFTSVEDILDSDYKVTPSKTLLNYPVVPLDSKLAAGGAQPLTGWYKGQEVQYFDFGDTTHEVAQMYAFITGYDDYNRPKFVQGQQNILGAIPGDGDYSSFWAVNLVTVPDDYEPNSIKSVREIWAAGYKTYKPGVLLNSPIPDVDLPMAKPVAAVQSKSEDTKTTSVKLKTEIELPKIETEKKQPEIITSKTELTSDMVDSALPTTGGNQLDSGSVVFILGLIVIGSGVFFITRQRY